MAWKPAWLLNCATLVALAQRPQPRHALNMSRNSASAGGVRSERKAGESLPGALEQAAAMPRPIAHPVLYLDYDGVLHPGEVSHVRGRIILTDSILGIAAPDSLSLMRTRLRELATGLES